MGTDTGSASNPGLLRIADDGQVFATASLLARAHAIARQHLSTLPVHRAIIRVVETLMVGAEPLIGPVLDVGCGDGHFAGACLVPSYGARIDVGIDPAFASVREAHQAGVYRMALACGGQALPFADGSFPTVVSNCVLEHIPPLEETLREIHRVLAPGGKLIITVPSDQFAGSLFWSRTLARIGFPSAGAAYGKWFNRISLHFHTYNRDGWQDRLQEAGFKVEKWTSYLLPDVMALFDLSHYYGVPTLVTKRLTGRWILWPGKWRYFPWERALENALASWARQIAVPNGSYFFFVARKA